MKKTLTINLSGIVFHIDEDAYEALNNYINKIKNNFSASEGRDEIIADIEARIAELFTSKISTASQVITISHITEIIGVMGKPEDYIADGEPQQNKDTTSEQQQASSQQTKNTSGKKRIFRDPDDRVFGGVCSGIAAYFDIDPIWIRIAFAVSFFGFGTGLLLYILLLIIIPKARTTADKLEMRGEPVNVDSISKAIKEEVGQIKQNANKLKDELNDPAHKNNFRSVITKVVDFIAQLIASVFKLVGKFFVAFVVLICIILVVALFVSLFGTDTIHINNNGQEFNSSLYDYAALLFNNHTNIVLAGIALLLLIGLPLLSLIYSGIRFLFGVKHKIKILNMASAILWMLGVGITIYLVVVTVNDFSANGKQSEQYVLNPIKSNTVFIKANVNQVSADEEDKGVLIADEDDNVSFFMKDEQLYLSRVDLKVTPSENDSFQLSITKLAHGKNKKEAIDRSNKINYSFMQNDSVLLFDYLVKVAADNHFRNQKIKLNLKVPEGKSVYFDKSAMRIIYDIENETNTLDSDMLNHTWIMKNKTLVCTDCKSKQPNENDEE